MMRATINLPPSTETKYVRVELDGETAGFLNPKSYDVVFKEKSEFEQAMTLTGAEEEAHSTTGRWVVRLRGEAALSVLFGHLSQR
jgi:hypothetical protein